jgi:hypothetical protein
VEGGRGEETTGNPLLRGPTSWPWSSLLRAVADHEHGAVHALDHAFGDAADERVVEAGSALRRDHDERGVEIGRAPRDHRRGLADLHVGVGVGRDGRERSLQLGGGFVDLLAEPLGEGLAGGRRKTAERGEPAELAGGVHGMDGDESLAEDTRLLPRKEDRAERRLGQVRADDDGALARRPRDEHGDGRVADHAFGGTRAARRGAGRADDDEIGAPRLRPIDQADVGRADVEEDVHLGVAQPLEARVELLARKRFDLGRSQRVLRVQLGKERADDPKLGQHVTDRDAALPAGLGFRDGERLTEDLVGLGAEIGRSEDSGEGRGFGHGSVLGHAYAGPDAGTTLSSASPSRRCSSGSPPRSRSRSLCGTSRSVDTSRGSAPTSRP